VSNVVGRVTRKADPTHLSLAWLCVGCREYHVIFVQGEPYDNRPKWDWNGSLEKPTISPSILSHWTWGPEHEPRVCHSFVREGVVEFLSDCTHPLAGQHVPMKPEHAGFATFEDSHVSN
jgi:uncharacterized protein DUF6527